LVSDDPTITEHLADAYLKVGRTQEALNLFQQAYKRAKDRDQIRRLQSKIEALGAKPETAEQHGEKGATP
jgi:predicted negative regulator of RcsB-dependent stress response